MFALSPATDFSRQRLPQPASSAIEHAAPYIDGSHSDHTDCPLELIASLGVSQVALPGDEIVTQGERSSHCYQIVSGFVRLVRLLEDGRRYIDSFLAPGDAFGWKATETQPFAVEALTAVTCRRFSQAIIEKQADQNGVFANAWRHLIVEQASRSCDHALLLGRMTAIERIASFLLDMQLRLLPDDHREFELPMSRVDMADYLGLTIETVSRGLGALRKEGAIAVDRSRIVVLSQQKLERVSG